MDSRGFVTTCAICGSKNHCAKNCADKEDRSAGKKDDHKNVFLTFKTIVKKLLSECGSIADLDTACTTSVASEKWLKKFAKAVKLRREKSSGRIVFGNNLGSESLSTVFVPVRIADYCCVLEIEIIGSF